MTTGKLRDIKAINNVIVRWAYYDAKRHGPTQCRRCQEWSHGSSHCHVAPACVKCVGQHETSACNLAAKGIKLPVEQLKCAYCKLQHTANYGGCKIRKYFIKNQPKRQPRQQKPSYAPQFNNANRWPGLYTVICFPSFYELGNSVQTFFAGLCYKTLDFISKIKLFAKTYQ
jgi:hypothetical protein